MGKTLDNANIDDLKKNVADVKLQGDPEAWQLVSKASSAKQGWMKSTKRMQVEGGHIYQVTSEHQNEEGETIACAEAVTFVPDIGEVFTSVTLNTNTITSSGDVLPETLAEAVEQVRDQPAVTITKLAPHHPNVEQLLGFFVYKHLPVHLQAISKPYADLAHKLANTVPSSPELTASLRKLLESKDAGVRAALSPPS